jgi:phage shock protein A
MRIQRLWEYQLWAKVDNLIQEYNSLQALTDNLKKEMMELHSYATQLEQELELLKRKTIDFCRTVDFLEVKLSSI